MKVKWLGHACFLITDENGFSIITDPYETTGFFADKLKFAPVDLPADVVTISHEHEDHNHSASVKGNPIILREGKTVKGVEFKSIGAFHDDANGSKAGKSTIFCFTLDGVRLCHLGDLGHLLSASQVSSIGSVDVLLIPVGGGFTIGAAAADKNIALLKPRVVIPMHFKNDKCLLPIGTADEFLSGKTNVVHTGKSEVEFNPSSLPAEMQIMVLKCEL